MTSYIIEYPIRTIRASSHLVSFLLLSGKMELGKINHNPMYAGNWEGWKIIIDPDLESVDFESMRQYEGIVSELKSRLSSAR